MKYKLITGTQYRITDEIEKRISDGWETCGNMFITGEKIAPNRGGFVAPEYAILMQKKSKPEIGLVSPEAPYTKSNQQPGIKRALRCPLGDRFFPNDEKT